MKAALAAVALGAGLCQAAKAWDNVEEIKGGAESAYNGSFSLEGLKRAAAAAPAIEGVAAAPAAGHDFAASKTRVYWVRLEDDLRALRTMDDPAVRMAAIREIGDDLNIVKKADDAGESLNGGIDMGNCEYASLATMSTLATGNLAVPLTYRAGQFDAVALLKRLGAYRESTGEFARMADLETVLQTKLAEGQMALLSSSGAHDTVAVKLGGALYNVNNNIMQDRVAAEGLGPGRLQTLDEWDRSWSRFWPAAKRYKAHISTLKVLRP